MKRSQKKLKSKAERSWPKSIEVPGCGKVPLVEKTINYMGNQYTGVTVDENFTLKSLPVGAIPANLKAQNLIIKLQNFSLSDVPPLYYKDKVFTCSRCKNTAIWTAQEQKRWREDYKFDCTGIRHCLKCRKYKRQANKLNNALSKAYQLYNDAPEDMNRMITLSKAIIVNYKETGQGSLDYAICLARKARKHKHNTQSLYWEGLALLLAGHKEKSKRVLLAYIDAMKLRPCTPSFLKNAKQYLSNLS